MEREIELSDITDGRLYDKNDMVRADCNECRGCSACCMGMGDTIILDPYDVFMLKKNRELSFQGLLKESLQLRVVEGIVLPNMMMSTHGERCFYLSSEGRCSIHDYRPGFCRLFPLGRLYEDGTFRYFLLVNECEKRNRTKVKVRKWIDIPNFDAYERFISTWHYLLKELSKILSECDDTETSGRVCMMILDVFYTRDFGEDFYGEFFERVLKVKDSFGVKADGGVQ